MIKITITIWEGNTDTNPITNIPLTETEENNTHCYYSQILQYWDTFRDLYSECVIKGAYA